MTKRTLTESERSTISNGLRVAAELYREDIHRTSPDFARLADQFTRQAADALALAEQIDEAENITLEV